MQQRAVQQADIAGMKVVLDTIELFPSEYLNDMIADFFQNPETEAIWLTAMLDDKVAGLAYCAPEQFTEGTFNLYAVGVHTDQHGNGIGSQLIAHLEHYLREKGHRILIIETSSGSNHKYLTSSFGFFLRLKLLKNSYVATAMQRFLKNFKQKNKLEITINYL